MAVIFLEPRDLTSAQAALVLEFLNRAQSAAEIDQRVAFPNETDIGVKLAVRLFAGRAAVGGRYTRLEQVAAVRLIGPERFTELCVAILGFNPAAVLDGLLPAAAQQIKLLERIAELERRVSALAQSGARARLELTANPAPAWLGQRLDLVVQARDASGAPLAGRRLTVEVSNGLLEAVAGYDVDRERALSVLTDTEGVARLGLRYLTLEPVTDLQQAAFEAAFEPLDVAAPSPDLLRDAFFAIAAVYADAREEALRVAIDIHARQWRAAFFEQLNANAFGFEWPHETCTVHAHCHPEGGGAESVGEAVLVVVFKNWVGAWFSFLAEFLSQQSGLDAAFAAAKGRSKRGYALVDSLIGEAHGFVADQRGLSALWASQRVVQDSVTEFLGNQLGNVDLATQGELFANLEAAVSQLTPAHRGTVGMVARARAEIDAQVGQTRVELEGKLGNLNQSVLLELDKLRIDIGGIQTNVTHVASGITSLQNEVSGIQTNVQSVQLDVGRVRLDLNKLGGG